MEFTIIGFNFIISIIMLISQNRKGDNRLYHPFFTRTEVYDSNITTTQSYSYKYILTGIARNNTCGLATYETYFLSKYTVEYLKERGRADFKLDFKHLSMFFKHCIRLLSIRSIIQPHTTTVKINGFINDFFGYSHLKINQSRSQSRGVNLQNKQNREDEIKNLSNCVKPFVNNIFQQQLKLLKKEEAKAESAVLLISKLTEKWLNEIEKDLEDQKQMSNQVLPECFTKLSKKRTKDFIIKNFEKIIKIQALKTTAKKDILQLFLDINRNFMMVKIPFIMQSSMKPKEKQTANQIILPRYTDENQIIACKLISKSKKTQYAIKLQQNTLRNQFELIKDLILYLCKYNKSTHYFYPNITAQDVYFDERKLKIFVTHHPLILDGIGIKKSSKPLQLQLACEPTPQFDFQQCHLEWQNKCKLKQKYYFPAQYKRKVDDSDEDFNEQVKNNQTQRLEQQIHVWRVINIVYYISNNRKMTNSLYSYYRPNQPFYFKSYKEVVKQIYQDLSKNADFLIKLLPPVQFQLQCSKLKQNGQEFSQNELKKKVQNIMKSLSNKRRQDELDIIKNRTDNEQKFYFSLEDLRQKFNIPDDEEDSLLQDLKLKSIKAELYLRTIIVKQLNCLLLDKKSFKKLSNAKKYLLLYFIYMFQDLYFMQVCRKKKKVMTNFKQQLKAEMQKGHNGLNLSEQSEKRKNNRINCFQKLIQYNERDYDDNNRNFLKKNPEFMEDIKKVHQMMHLIKRIQLVQSEYFFKTKPTQQQIETLLQENSVFLSKQDIQILAFIKYEIKLIKCLQDLQINLSQPISSLPEKQKERMIRQIIEEIISNIICDTDIRKDSFLEQFFSILLQKSQQDKIALVITYLNQQHKVDDLKDRLKEDLIMILVQSLNKSQGQLQSKMIQIKKILNIDEQNLPKLVNIVHYLIDKLKRSRVFEEFKENWSNRMQQKMRYSHKIITTNIDKLLRFHIQPYLKNPQNFHKLSDFNGKVEVCLFYNQKLLTLMKFFLSINRRNWKSFERVYNLMQIEDKTVNFRSQLKAIDTRDVNDIKIDIRKLELLRDTPIKEVQEINLDRFNKMEENNNPNNQSLDLSLKKTYD